MSKQQKSGQDLKVPFPNGQTLEEVERNISYLEGKLAGDKQSKPYIWLFFVILPLIFTLLRFRGIVLFPPWIYILLWIALGLGAFMFIGIIENLTKGKAELKRYQKKYKRLLNAQQLTADIRNSTPSPMQNSVLSDAAANYRPEQESQFKRLIERELLDYEARYQTEQISYKWGMGFSFLLATVGLFMIIGGSIAGFKSGNMDAAYLAVTVGIIIEAIAAALFLWLNSKRSAQLKDYQDGMARLQKILLYFKLIESAKDEADKKMMVQKMVDYVIEDDFLNG